MRVEDKTLIKCIVIPLIIGAISGLIASPGLVSFGTVAKPGCTPPSWVFPIVWTILYMLMGIASYMIFVSNVRQDIVIRALTLYSLQLVVNFFWSIIFFSAKAYLLAFLWLIFLWVMVLATIKHFLSIKPQAGLLLIPYILWITFAGYLNLNVYLMN